MYTFILKVNDYTLILNVSLLSVMYMSSARFAYAKIANV